MHQAVGAGKGQAGLLINGKGIHIGPDKDPVVTGAFGAYDFCNDTGGIGLAVGNAQFVQFLTDLLGGAKLLQAGFGILVDVPAESDHLGLYLVSQSLDIH